MSQQTYGSTSEPADFWNHVSTPTPRLVLSVIGDSYAFVPRAWDHMAFKTAMVDTAKRAGGCLMFYSGIDFGLGRLVGDIIGDYDMHRSKFMAIESKKRAKEDGIQLVAMTQHNILQESENNNNIDIEKQRSLNKNAHHYVFIKHDMGDDDLERLKYTETLVSIEKYINRQKVPLFTTVENGKVLQMRIPVVIVVAEGDLNTIEHVALAVEQNLPILLIQGSGKAADLLVECIVNKESLIMKGPTLIGIYFDRTEFEKLQNLIERIRKKLWLINVFNLQADYPCKMSEIIGDGVLRAWSMEYTQGPAVPSTEQKISATYPSPFIGASKFKAVTKFINPMSKKRACPITEAEVELGDPNFRPASKLHFHLIFQFLQETGRIKSRNAERLLFEAVKENRLEFVAILLQHGVKFRHEYFWDLYKETIECKNHKNTQNCHHIHGILMDIDNITPLLFRRPGKKEKQVCAAGAAKTICQTLLRFSRESLNYHDNVESRTDDLLLWSLFANNKGMAELFWQRSTYPLLAALISSAVLDLLSKRADRLEQDIVSEQFKEHAEVFEDKAMDLLDKLYEQDDEKAMGICTKDVTLWGIDTSPMAFSYQYYRMRFLAHRCCQLTLKKKWYAGIASNFSAFIRVRRKGVEEKKKKPKQEQNASINDEDKKPKQEHNASIGDKDKKPKQEHNASINDEDKKPKQEHNASINDEDKKPKQEHNASINDEDKKPKQEHNASINDEDKTKQLIKKLMNKQKVVAEAGEKLRNFLTAPVTKFFVNYVIFFVFLILFSIYLINGVASTTTRSQVLEVLIAIWMFGDMFEELYGVVPAYRERRNRVIPTQSLSFHIRRWLYDFWNSMDVMCYIVYIAAFIAKRLEDTAPYIITRRLYTLCLFLVYMRFLYAFLIFKVLGPYIIMIKQMLQDLWRFVFILAVFIAAVGVSYHVNRFPNHKQFFGDGMKEMTIWQIASMPFWQLFGETFLEELEADDKAHCGNGTDSGGYDCPKYDPIVILTSAIYMLFSNLLLVNVIIAMFSFRFEKVHTDSKRVWKYYRYSVVTEYLTKIPTPLNILIRPFICLRNLCREGRKSSLNHKSLKNYLYTCCKKTRPYRQMVKTEGHVQHWQGVNAAGCVGICRQASVVSQTSSI